MTQWNKRQEPISERLRDPDQILEVVSVGPKEDFSVDLDDEGWIWHDELVEVKQ